jgi:hypothetical protein
MENTSMSKIHFLFIMLNISQLTVLRKGVIKGIITKHEFIKRRRADEVKVDLSAVNNKKKKQKQNQNQVKADEAKEPLIEMQIKTK